MQDIFFFQRKLFKISQQIYPRRKTTVKWFHCCLWLILRRLYRSCAKGEFLQNIVSWRQIRFCEIISHKVIKSFKIDSWTHPWWSVFSLSLSVSLSLSSMWVCFFRGQCRLQYSHGASSREQSQAHADSSIEKKKKHSACLQLNETLI